MSANTPSCQDLVLHVANKVKQIIGGKYLFESLDKHTKDSVEQDITAFFSSMVGRQIEDFTVSSRWRCALWGIIDGKLTNPANPDADPVAICADGRVYDINNDKFLSGSYNARLVSEIREALEDLDIPISLKAPMNELHVRVLFKPVHACDVMEVEMHVAGLKYE